MLIIVPLASFTGMLGTESRTARLITPFPPKVLGIESGWDLSYTINIWLFMPVLMIGE